MLVCFESKTQRRNCTSMFWPVQIQLGLKMFCWHYLTDPILGADPRYFYSLFSCENDKKPVKMKQSFYLHVGVSSTFRLFQDQE